MALSDTLVQLNTIGRFYIELDKIQDLLMREKITVNEFTTRENNLQTKYLR